MKLDFLPEKILNIVGKNYHKLSEVRFRKNFPISVLLDGKRRFISESGFTDKSDFGICCEQADIDYVINRVTEKSLYAFNDEIKNGYVTTKDGIRIGLSGTCVTESGKIVTIKNFTSLNVRLPHKINNCSDTIYDVIFEKNKKFVKSTLIIAPPAGGKTTLLKDLCLKFDCCSHIQILLIDERGEFSDIVGKNIDKLSYSDKQYAFDCGIRSLSPNLVITDELASESDWNCVKIATLSGTTVIASCHGKNIKDVTEKNGFKKNIFERYFVVGCNGNPGKIEKIYDENFNEICLT